MAAPGRGSDGAIRALLPRTGSVFFGRFRRLTPIQRGAIPRILRGGNLLLTAPTATGKTEAFMAPLTEIHVRPQHGDPVILYIAPTRALVNDAFRRLETPLHRLGVGLARKTSDHPTLPRKRPSVLITTPESLDSLLVRRPRYVTTVRAVILDELHALDGTPRGDQLACLLERLRRIAAAPVQVVAASATVDDPSSVARRYFQEGGILHAPGRRILPHRIAPCGGQERLAPLLQDAVGRGFEKVLAFANSRAEVESTASRLKGRAPFGDDVYAHHGSLSREERARTELRFLGSRRALFVATMTLELGIDIGDVDMVALLAPPPSVTALLQRTGRAGRRGQAAEVLALSSSDREEFLYRHLFAAATEGRLLQDPPVYDPSVVLQQALSICLQNRKKEVDAKGLAERLPPWQRSYWTESALTAALRKLAEAGLLEDVGGAVFGSTSDLEELRRRGSIHANIARDGDVTVWDETTGRAVGSVSDSARRGDDLALGAAAWTVVGASSDGLRVRATDSSGAPSFQSRGFPLTGSAHALALKGLMGHGPEVLIRRFQDGVTHFFHGLGTAWGELFRFALLDKAIGGPGTLIRPWGATVRGAVTEPRLDPDRGFLVKALRSRRKRLAALLPFGPYFGRLPDAEQDRAILTAFRLDAFLDLSSRFRTIDVPDAETTARMELFERT